MNQRRGLSENSWDTDSQSLRKPLPEPQGREGGEQRDNIRHQPSNVSFKYGSTGKTDKHILRNNKITGVKPSKQAE